MIFGQWLQGSTLITTTKPFKFYRRSKKSLSSHKFVHRIWARHHTSNVTSSTQRSKRILAILKSLSLRRKPDEWWCVSSPIVKLFNFYIPKTQFDLTVIILQFEFWRQNLNFKILIIGNSKIKISKIVDFGCYTVI